MRLLQVSQGFSFLAIIATILFVGLFILIFPPTMRVVRSNKEYKHYGFFRQLWIALTDDAKFWSGCIAIILALAMPEILVTNFIFQQSTTSVDETYAIQSLSNEQHDNFSISGANVFVLGYINGGSEHKDEYITFIDYNGLLKKTRFDASSTYLKESDETPHLSRQYNLQLYKSNVSFINDFGIESNETLTLYIPKNSIKKEYKP